MPWGFAIGAVATLGAGAMQAQAGQDGADAQSDAARYATDEQRRQYEQTRSDMAPWLSSGSWALGEQQNFLEGDFGNAFASPFYAATLSEGFKGLDAGAAAGGNLWGGGTDADRMALGQTLASNQLNTYYNALAGLSGTGQTTANQLGQFGANYANAAGQNAMYGAGAQASAYANNANAWGNVGNQLAGGFADWYGGLGSDSQGRYLGNQRGRG